MTSEHEIRTDRGLDQADFSPAEDPLILPTGHDHLPLSTPSQKNNHSAHSLDFSLWETSPILSQVERPVVPSLSSTPPRGSSSRLERWFIKQLYHNVGLPHLAYRLWDGWEYCGDSPIQPDYHLVIRNRTALRRLIPNPNYYFLEGYAHGQLEVEGSLMRLLNDLNANLRFFRMSPFRSFLRQLRLSIQRHSLQRSRQNASYHYNLGNDFYKLWLDEQLVYTCAYFPTADTSLEAAQIAKLDHVCRKLDLKPGETVVEAGCGWGALALHMARSYGVKVRAYNVSSEQVRYARERAHAAHLERHVEFVQDDWRNITGQADAFVSVGMLEHVGPENYSLLGKVAAKCLAGRGRGLIHTIGQNFPQPLNPWIEEKIFPGAQPPSLAQLVDLCPAGELIVLDVENLRLHYAETLRHWLHRFENSLDRIRSMHDETFIRAWRMYLVSSCSAFATGGLQLYQMLFAPGASNAIPRTREYQYRDPNASHPNGSLEFSHTGGQLPPGEN